MGAYGSTDNCFYTDFGDMARPTMHRKQSKYYIYRLCNISSGLFLNEQVELGQAKYTPGHKFLCQVIAAVQYCFPDRYSCRQKDVHYAILFQLQLYDTKNISGTSPGRNRPG